MRPGPLLGSCCCCWTEPLTGLASGRISDLSKNPGKASNDGPVSAMRSWTAIGVRAECAFAWEKQVGRDSLAAIGKPRETGQCTGSHRICMRCD